MAIQICGRNKTPPGGIRSIGVQLQSNTMSAAHASAVNADRSFLCNVSLLRAGVGNTQAHENAEDWVAAMPFKPAVKHVLLPLLGSLTTLPNALLTPTLSVDMQA